MSHIRDNGPLRVKEVVCFMGGASGGPVMTYNSKTLVCRG